MTQAEDEARLIAVIPDANRQFCFLMAPDLHPIEAQSDGMCGPVLSAFRVQTDGPGIVRLKHPLSPTRFLGVTRPGEGSEAGCVVFDSLGQSMLDAFLLVPAQTVPNTARIAAMELAEASARPFLAARLLAQLRGGIVRPELAETLLRLLPLDEMTWLGAWLMSHPEDLAWLGHAMPTDRWITQILPALAAWAQTRQAPRDHVIVSPAADECAADPLEGFGQPQLGLALTGLARQSVTPRRNACILAAARNEGPYLLDWLAYHRAVGFEHFFLYTNDNDDGSDALLAALANAGVITWIRNETGTHVGPQYKAYAHALTMLPQCLDYRWTAILDLDEYFAFDTRLFASVADVIAWHETQPVDALALCWLIFAAGADQHAAPGPAVELFTRREQGVNQHVKSLFRTNRFWHAQPHFPYATMGAPFIYRTETGALHHHPGTGNRIAAFAEKPSASLAWINHYLLRTAPESLWKLARGLGDWPVPTQERQANFTNFVARSFAALAAAPLVEDTRILACAPHHAAERERLLDLPGIAAAQTAIEASFLPKLKTLTQDFLAAATPEDPDCQKAFRHLLSRHG